MDNSLSSHHSTGYNKSTKYKLCSLSPVETKDVKCYDSTETKWWFIMGKVGSMICGRAIVDNVWKWVVITSHQYHPAVGNLSVWCQSAENLTLFSNRLLLLRKYGAADVGLELLPGTAQPQLLQLHTINFVFKTNTMCLLAKPLISFIPLKARSTVSTLIILRLWCKLDNIFQRWLVMYTLLSGLYRHLTQKDEYFILILGLDNAGLFCF